MGRKDFQENWRFLDTAVSNTHSTLSESLLTAWDSRCNTLVLVMKCTLFAWFTGTTINLSVHTVYYSVCQMLYTVFRKKHPLTFSIITLASIFIIFVSVEREMNTLLTYNLDDVITVSHYTSLKFTSFMELRMNIGQLYWKTPTFVWIITLAFLGRFLFFLNYGNGNEYFTNKSTKFTTSLTVSPHYLT